MVASSVTILGPPDGVNFPNTIVRPVITVKWAGGTGPFDVEYTWDDDATFANGNGNRQIVTNTSVTSPDDGVPTADLGDLSDGTVWYLRANVIDQGDSGAALADSDNDFTYFDPASTAYFRYLHLLTNVSPGFTFDTPKETQLVANNATSGTFTLSLDGVGPTASINYNSTAGALATAIEGLSNVTDVEVWPLSDQAWLVRFISTTADPIPAMTANSGGLTGGTASVDVIVDDSTPWGTGGTTEPDGANRDLLKYLHLLANNGVGFSTDAPAGGWGTGGTVAPDGDTRDTFGRYLHQLVNVNSNQPTPFIFRIEPSVAREGDSIRIYGQGLVGATFPTADPYGAEVRLYQQNDLASPYALMPISNYIAGETEDIIDVTVPVAAEEGTFDYVGVFHTIGV